jgi:hypothetical protein
MTLGIDHEALNRSDSAIGGMNLVATVHLHLAERNAVDDHRVALGAGQRRLERVVRPRQRVLTVAEHVRAARQEADVLGIVQRAEMLHGAAQADLVVVHHIDQVDGHQPSERLMVGRGDDHVGEYLRHRVDDHTHHLAAFTVGGKYARANVNRFAVAERTG